MRSFKEFVSEKFDVTHVKKDFDKVVDWFEEVSDVSYDGSGTVIVKGKSKIRKNKDMNIFKGNAQLGGNLAKAIADHFKLKEPKMGEV